MAEKDKVYKCLNPRGIEQPQDMFPLSPRLDTIDGKTIVLSLTAAGEQDIAIPLSRRLPIDYPNVNWIVSRGRWRPYMQGDESLTEEDKTADAVIQGVGW